MTNSTVDRFQILEVNQLTYPHKCGICGSFSGDNGKRYIDFGLFVEYHGQVYICVDCFYGAIHSIDKPSDESQARIRELQAVVTTLIAENRTLRNALDELRGSIVSRPDSDPDSVYVAPSSVIEAGTAVEQDPAVGVTSEPDPVGEAREAESTEQINVEGSPQLREDDDDLIGLDIFKL